ncbi:MAG TPA: SDR family oxidoreductase [Dehalococcoidia bacterium]|nr:SDR family oxidoreductase [Dehalococcoidia bacterium]
MNLNLDGKVAVVTGAAQGMGRAIALTFIKGGASVVAADIDLEAAKLVAEEAKALGAQAIAVRADVTKSEQVAEMVKSALEGFGKVDILVNVVGGSGRLKGRKLYLFRESTEEDWDSAISLNLKATMICTKAVLDHMIERKNGRIINISSVSALAGNIGMVDYSAAKAGVIGFTVALAKEVGPYNITVNCILPGPTETPGMKELNLPPESLEEMGRRTYLGRVGKPEDIANMAIFLASDGASFITGQSYAVCGARNLA